MSDSIRRFEHSHAHLASSMLTLRRLVDGDAHDAQLVARVEEFRDQLLDHFANEEEVLFPFIRERDAASAPAVDALIEAHDALCASIVRLAHAIKHASPATARAAYAKFQTLYAKHSLDEATLLEQLAERLSPAERRSLDEQWRALESS